MNLDFEQTKRLPLNLESTIIPKMQEVQFKLVNDKGSGRTFVLLVGYGPYLSLAGDVAQELATSNRTLLVEISELHADECEKVADRLLVFLQQQSVRVASIVGFGPTCAVAQSIGLRQLKIIRTMVLIDGTSRPSPNRRDRMVDWLESNLPLGLPFRGSTAGFDSRPFLQRLRCPVMIGLTPGANQYLKSQAHILAQNLPTSWFYQFSGVDNVAQELKDILVKFQEVPAKCPQKA